MEKEYGKLKFELTPELRRAIEKSKSEVEDLSKTLQKLALIFQESLKNLPKSLLILANSGWYISWDTPPGKIQYYAEQIVLNNLNNIDTAIVSDLENNINQIESTLINNFPHRKNVLLAAFNAHREKKYYLSIPVFIAQTEGISKEITGYRFFSQKNFKPVISEWVSTFQEDSFTRLLLEPLNIINDSRKVQDHSNPNGLNRHDILHGDCFDYGDNIVNSFKTLSQLYFLGDVVFTLKKDLNNSKYGS